MDCVCKISPSSKHYLTTIIINCRLSSLGVDQVHIPSDISHTHIHSTLVQCVEVKHGLYTRKSTSLHFADVTHSFSSQTAKVYLQSVEYISICEYKTFSKKEVQKNILGSNVLFQGSRFKGSRLKNMFKLSMFKGSRFEGSRFKGSRF